MFGKIFTTNCVPLKYLNLIKDYHRKFNLTASHLEKYNPNNIYDGAFQAPYKEPQFSGEENQGRCIDLHNYYQEFINLKKLKLSEDYSIGDYLWYL